MTLRLCIRSFLFVTLTGLLLACGSEQATDGQTAETEASSDALPTSSHPDTSGWTQLFASDLSNASTSSPDSWEMKDGVLVANDRTTIWSDEEYGNFVLDFEANAPEETNSGVFFRTADTSDILSAIELQVVNPEGSESSLGDKNGMGALYDLKGTSGGSLNQGDWNRFTVTARDSMIFVVLNGEQVHRMNLNEWTTPGMTPDGEEHKFDRALADQAESGPIGIQGIHSDRGISVKYRNLKIRSLDE